MRHLIKLCLLALTTLSLHAWGNSTDALKTLNLVAPKTAWDAKSVIEIDIDCDNHKDYVFLNQTGEKANLGIVLGKEINKAYLSAITMRNAKKEVCADPAGILPESMDYDPKFVTGKSITGFKRSKCQAFRLTSTKCEPYHFYWNTLQDRPAWWRRSK